MFLLFHLHPLNLVLITKKIFYSFIMNNYRFEFYMFEPITLIPSSLMSVSWRAIRQYFYFTWPEQLKELLFQRRIGQIALHTLLKLIAVPLLANFLATNLIFSPVVHQLWTKQSDVFLHRYLEKQAYQEFEAYQNEIYFDFFLNPSLYTKQYDQVQRYTIDYCILHNGCHPLEYEGSRVQSKLQEKMVEITKKYNQKSIDTLIRLLGDALTLTVFFSIVATSGPQVFLLKVVILESLSGLHDITRSVMIIFTVNLLVGYHSPRGWELILQILIDRGNWPLGETFILFVVGTLPVIIDTCFKYWIFRYLNKSLPTTVVTYHRMIE